MPSQINVKEYKLDTHLCQRFRCSCWRSLTIAITVLQNPLIISLPSFVDPPWGPYTQFQLGFQIFTYTKRCDGHSAWHLWNSWNIFKFWHLIFLEVVSECFKWQIHSEMQQQSGGCKWSKMLSHPMNWQLCHTAWWRDRHHSPLGLPLILCQKFAVKSLLKILIRRLIHCMYFLILWNFASSRNITYFQAILQGRCETN